MKNYTQNSFILNGKSTCLRKLDQALQKILHALDSTNLFEIYLILEELISNIYLHGSRGKQTPRVNIRLNISSSKILLLITDTGPDFDPTQKIVLKRGCSLEEKQVGGLGLFLIQNMVDTMNYTRVGSKNSLMITKNVIKAKKPR